MKAIAEQTTYHTEPNQPRASWLYSDFAEHDVIANAIDKADSLTLEYPNREVRYFKPEVIYLNEYAFERRYGGPEEGGWTYGHYEPVRTVLSWDNDGDVTLDDALEISFDLNQSTEDEGIVFMIEPHEPLRTEKPYYC